jgi:hypothetical protein
MFGRMVFKYLSESNQINRLKERGIVLGTRFKNGKKVHLYLLEDFCVEVIYANREETSLESIKTFATVQKFNSYLENEFKTSF